MISRIIILIHIVQASFSAYNLYLASIAISKLQKYEGTSKKAAKYSTIAENQLHKTRTTQACGTLAVSLPSPVVLLYTKLISRDRFYSPSSLRLF
jgi:hypothetical protein